MELSKLIEGVEIRKIVGETRKDIEGIAYHSRQVGKNFLFAAIRGLEADGHRFIDDAIGRGAEAILLEEGPEMGGRTAIFVPSSRQALARVASNFYGDPSAKMRLVGITGTNGKTTTTFLLESILKKAGSAVGVIGTINYRYGQKVVPALNTTPESLDLQRILREMSGEGISHVIMEVSSHGLDLDRVFGCQFDGAVFTNFTSDHLDYHQTLERYFESKKKLFFESLMKSPQLLDDPWTDHKTDEQGGQNGVDRSDGDVTEDIEKGDQLMKRIEQMIEHFFPPSFLSSPQQPFPSPSLSNL